VIRGNWRDSSRDFPRVTTFWKTESSQQAQTVVYTGKIFRLQEPVLGIESVNGRHAAVMLPAGEVVRVLSGPRPDDRRLVEILWEARRLMAFVEDLDSGSVVLGLMTSLPRIVRG